MKTRKLLAIVLAVAMLASFVSIPVFAEGEGEALETLGILVGTGDGVTEEYLASTATRAQAALIHLRLMSHASDALAFEGTETFTDAADATEYWQPILEYLKANEELGWQGYPDGSFDPNGTITGQEFTKVILVALGYEEGVDFTWETSTDFAASLGIVALVDKVDEVLTIADIADALVEALGTKTTAAINVSLLTWLVMEGVIDAEDAEAAGFTVEDPALVIVSAGPTAVDEITVEMSTDVPEDSTINLKRGSVGIVVNEAIDGSTITLTGLYNFFAGTYTVTVDGESASFVIQSQMATDLVIGTDSVFDDGVQDLKVSLLDQYGDAMSLAGTNKSVFNQTNGYVFTPQVSTTLKVDTTLGTTEAGDTIYIFVYDPVSQLTVTGTVVVLEAPYIVSIEIGDVTIGKIGDTTQTRLYETTEGNVLDVTAWDQYGDEYILDDADIDTSVVYTDTVQVLSSNENVISAGGIVATGPNADGDLVFEALAPGSAMITLIIPNQSFIATSQMITVYALAELNSIVAQSPAEVVYAAEEAEIPAVGYDQYGDEADFDGGDAITFTVTNPAVIDSGDISVTDVNEITFVPTSDGTTTVFYFLDGILQGSVDIVVQPEAYPFQVTGVAVAGALETGVWVGIDAEDITVIDQYGRTMSDPFAGDYTYVLEEVTDDGHVNLGWTGVEEYVLSTAGLDAGTETFAAYLSTGGARVLESAYQFSVENIAAADIDGFAMAEIAGTMYTGTTFVYNQSADDYYKTVSITGTAGELTVELLDTDGDGLPDIIDVVTSSDDAVDVVSGSIVVPTAESDGTATIKAWRNGVAVAMTDIDLDDTAPDCVTIAVTAEDDATAGDYDSMFTFKDQYGVGLTYSSYLSTATSPDGLLPYFEQIETEVGDDMYYTVIKWDGSLAATFVKTGGAGS